jgi:UDPglucose--hexose-1-phosphate uridylyltransferase
MAEFRYNYLKDTWSIIATERSKRPHDFNISIYEEETVDLSKCPFEYGNEDKTPPEIFAIRPDGSSPNTPGWIVRVIPNKYPALRIENQPLYEGYYIFDKIGGFGAHEVIIETPDHFKHIQDFEESDIVNMFIAFRERTKSLYQDLRIKYVHIFKNHGREAGKSLVHSHSQLIALPTIPKLQQTIIKQSKKYFQEKGRCYLCDEIKTEIKLAERVVYENESFISYCPYSSLYPFEVKIAPKYHSHDFSSITNEKLKDLADILKFTVRKLHKTLINPPFNLIVQSAPPYRDDAIDKTIYENIEKHFHWHIEILPRITTLAGFELGTHYYINPTLPEEAARYLREVV